ncbi:C2 domain-containing protein [Tieghemostelium lacteum]|uniref:C2 domain-containing protein n=1 Tax=Tieghemostelium lacteum TaxID=361077 RepID=A0A151ZFJ5_TIELA|nr:C2 domain-containing protein [Tieghemostelium lacteum]|eukprot:KYQ92640.1 C2 domain-containing protein [Tieghemostelium lacteum]
MNILQINVLEARDLVAADTNGFSDPYCVVMLGLQKKKTKIQKKTLNPKWGETFLLRVSPVDTVLKLSLLDWDQLSSDDFLGEVSIELDQLADAPTWYGLKPRPDHPNDFVKGEVCIKARIVKSSSSQKDKIPINMITEVNNRVSSFEENGDQLDISGIGLDQIPDFLFEHVPNVPSLDLGFNQFKMFPSLGMFTKLHSLVLAGNSILTIPGEVLTPLQNSLKYLSLNGNQLIALPVEIGKMRLLEKLEIANNKIAELCEEIGQLNKLEELNIAGNPLTKLPVSFCNLTSLEILDASGCALYKLPEDFPTMTKLLELNFGNNKLVELPQTFGRLTRLVVLNIMDNKLTDLPVSIGSCIGLGKIGAGINIVGNPIQSEEIIAKYKIGNDQLMDYLEKRMAIQGYKLPDLKPKASATGGLRSMGSQSKLTDLPQQQQQQQSPQQPVQPQYSLVNNGGKTSAASTSSNALNTQELISKTITLKNWGISTLRGELRPKLGKIKNQVLRCINIQEGVGIANMIKQMKPEADKLKTLIPPGFPLQPVNTQNVPLGKIHSGNEKLEQLKDLVNVSIDDYDALFDALYQILPNSQDSTVIIQVVQSLKKIKEIFDLQ